MESWRGCRTYNMGPRYGQPGETEHRCVVPRTIVRFPNMPKSVLCSMQLGVMSVKVARATKLQALHRGATGKSNMHNGVGVLSSLLFILTLLIIRRTLLYRSSISSSLYSLSQIPPLKRSGRRCLVRYVLLPQVEHILVVLDSLLCCLLALLLTLVELFMNIVQFTL